jgi:hypothetical protein
MTDANAPTDDTLRRWLLQQLTDADAQALDARLMHDDALAERLREAETDLIDDAARGALGADDAEAFRRYRLVDPQTRERLVAARAFARLREEEGGQEVVRRPHRRRLVWLAAAAIAAAAIVLPMRWTSPPATLPTYVLLAQTARGAEAALTLPAPQTTVRLQMEVVDATRRYALAIETNGRRTPIAQDLVPRESYLYAYVEARVEAALLGQGRRRVVLIAASGEVERDWTVVVGAAGE